MNTCTDIHKSQNNNVEWKKLDNSESIAYDPVYKQIAEYELICRESNQIGGCLGTRMCLQMAGKEELQRSMRTLLGMTSIPRLVCDGSQSHNQNLRSVHSTCIQFLVHCTHCTLCGGGGRGRL